MARILIIDDEENIRKTLREILEDESHEVFVAEDGYAGLKAFTEEKPDAVLLDIKMPGRDGLEILEELKKSGQDCEVIMISGHGTIDSAVRAVKAGAYHFLQKPLSMIEVKQAVRHAAGAKASRDEIRALKGDSEARYRMVGGSQALSRVLAQIDKVAPTEGRVLITGESGTGKELAAWRIHRGSPRREGPFVKINCAAIPANLIESELFGHEKGAFTGALAQKKGKFESADNGTLFLDEVGDMDLNTQTKVLRAIQEGEFERVGGVKTIKVNVRVVSATHRDLEKMISMGAFREDLFYRLNVVPLRMPALSERVEDVPVLAAHFLESYCRENGLPEKKFTPEALSALTGQKYRGNIRELRNVVERALILTAKPEIAAGDLAAVMESKENKGHDLFLRPRPLAEAKEELERVYVKTQLELNNWDIVKTAEVLGVHRTNLHRKIRQLNLTHPPQDLVN